MSESKAASEPENVAYRGLVHSQPCNGTQCRHYENLIKRVLGDDIRVYNYWPLQDPSKRWNRRNEESKPPAYLCTAFHARYKENTHIWWIRSDMLPDPTRTVTKFAPRFVKWNGHQPLPFRTKNSFSLYHYNADYILHPDLLAEFADTVTESLCTDKDQRGAVRFLKYVFQPFEPVSVQQLSSTSCKGNLHVTQINQLQGTPTNLQAMFNDVQADTGNAIGIDGCIQHLARRLMVSSSWSPHFVFSINLDSN